MSIQAKQARRRVCLAVLLIPAVLLLSSCMRLRAEFDIQSPDSIGVSMDVGVLKEIAGIGGGSNIPFSKEKCQSANGPVGDSKGEYYDDGKYMGCKLTGTTKIAGIKNDSIKFDEASKMWTFKMDSRELGQASGGTPGGQQLTAAVISDFHISVTFPGKVLTASGSGKVSGNTVTWEDPNDLFAAEGLKATADNSGRSNLTTWIIIGVIVVAIVAIGAAVYFLVIKKKAGKPSGPVPPYGGYGGQQPGGYPPPGGRTPPTPSGGGGYAPPSPPPPYGGPQPPGTVPPAPGGPASPAAPPGTGGFPPPGPPPAPPGFPPSYGRPPSYGGQQPPPPASSGFAPSDGGYSSSEGLPRFFDDGGPTAPIEPPDNK